MTTTDGSRYIVEQGADGSWLVVDRGADRQQRRAIAREEDRQAALAEASTLGGLEVTSSIAAPSEDEFGVDELIAGLSDTFDTQHNFDHLLRPE